MEAGQPCSQMSLFPPALTLTRLLPAPYCPHCLPCFRVLLLTVPSLGPSQTSYPGNPLGFPCLPKACPRPLPLLQPLRPSSNSPWTLEEPLLCFVLLAVGNIWGTSGFACPLPGPAGRREGGTLGLLPLRCHFFGLEVREWLGWGGDNARLQIQNSS